MTADQTEPILNLVGERVALGPLLPEHVPLHLRWANDWDVIEPRGMLLRSVGSDQISAWHERYRASDDIIFTIYEHATHRPIGETSFRPLDLIHRRAEFGIFIGEKDCWGQSYGTETARLMLRYGFTKLDLHNIYLRVSSHNARGIGAYTRAGFRECGRLREAVRIAGRAYDMIYMECLASEYDVSG